MTSPPTDVERVARERVGQTLARPLEDDPAPLLSIVVPACFEEGNLAKLHDELVAALDPLDLDWEVVFVDDGSEDGTWAEIVGLRGGDPRVHGVRLSRNFGHQYALIAGLGHASGRAVVMMDADLQHPPDAIPRLLEAWQGGAKIVHTHRVDEESISWLKKLTSIAFYRVFSFLSGVRLSPGMADFRLLDRSVVDELLKLPESGLFLRGLMQWIGYPSATVDFQCRERLSGQTKYSLRKMVKFAWTGITSFSIIPLRLGIVVGLLTSLFAFFQLGQTLYVRLFTDQAVAGWASLMGVTTLLFGVLFILLGIVGEYLARILEEVRGRPRFIVSESVGFSDFTEVGAAVAAPKAPAARLRAGASDHGRE